MEGKNFLFERSDVNQRTPVLLFEKWEFEQVKHSNRSKNLLSQFNLFHKQPFAENTSDSFFTPPVEKKSVSTPKAPIKYKKQSKKGDLRPKKLQYTDDELDASSVVDSGIHISFDQSSDTLFCKRASKSNKFDSSEKRVYNLRAKFDRIKVQTNDKENDKNVIENRFVNVSNNRNNIIQESSVVFNPNAEVLSQCDTNLNWKEKLYWLQPRRDVGLWIECCRKKCKKWRYAEDYHDPIDVPKKWYCEMNSDKLVASCNIPEHPGSLTVRSDLIENAYNAGSIVWAYIRGFLWWPGIVNDCPETFAYYELFKNSLKPIRYYVTFFYDEKLESTWIDKKNLKPFASYKYNELIKKTKFYGIDYKQSLRQAYEVATNALSLSILERLQRFSFLARYDRLYDTGNYLSRSVNITATNVLTDIKSDDEIPCSNPTKKQLSLKEYYLDVLCKNRYIK